MRLCASLLVGLCALVGASSLSTLGSGFCLFRYGSFELFPGHAPDPNGPLGFTYGRILQEATKPSGLEPKVVSSQQPEESIHQSYRYCTILPTEHLCIVLVNSTDTKLGRFNQI